MHRCAHLLRQQSSITVYRLSAKENKLPFSVSVCSKQTPVWRFCFPFTATNGSRFPLVPFNVYGIPEKWRHGHGGMETWRHCDSETWRWRHGNMEAWTWRHGEMKTWRHGHVDIKQKTKTQAIFLNPFTICSLWKRNVLCPFLWRRNKWKLSVCKCTKRTKQTTRTIRTCLSMYGVWIHDFRKILI